LHSVMTAMSGGVDSSVAAALLKEQGYKVLGGTMRLYEKCGIEQEISDAQSVCEKLGIEHFVFDMKEEFKQRVICAFSEMYSKGLTPNPCIECNKHLKFGALLKQAEQLGCDYIATGHYSRITKDENSNRYVLYRPEDRKKDQTYVLWRLSQQQLSRILMPLGDISKQAVREIAHSYGFVSANAKESQDICFVPDGDYSRFLEEFNGKPFKKGDYIDILGKKIGEHKGQECYTIGQRKGLGIALGKPQFVISKNPKTNEVVLGDEEHLFKNRVHIKEINMISALLPKSKLSCTAKLRYSAKDDECNFHPMSETEGVLEFKKPQRAPTPGQSAVLYIGDAVLGGGIIV